MNIFKREREYIISYRFISKKNNRDGFGHTYRKEANGKVLDFLSWHKETTDYWNIKLKTDDVLIIVTNIFENK